LQIQKWIAEIELSGQFSEISNLSRKLTRQTNGHDHQINFVEVWFFLEFVNYFHNIQKFTCTAEILQFLLIYIFSQIIMKILQFKFDYQTNFYNLTFLGQFTIKIQETIKFHVRRVNFREFW